MLFLLVFGEVRGMRGRPCKDYVYNGESHKLWEWARILDIKEATLRHRMIHKTFQEAVEIGKRGQTKRKKLYAMYNGRRMPVADIARETGFNYSTLRARLARGMSVEEALSTPVERKIPKSRKIDCPYPNCFECPFGDCVVDKI